MDYICVFLNYLLLIIFVLITVAFVTLMEQKILGSVQIRLGPTKVGYYGLLQPFSDAVKLFLKEYTFPRHGNNLLFFLLPFLSLWLVLCLWMVIPQIFGGFSFELSMMFFICVSSIAVFPILAMGWASNSKYSLLGGLRAVAQMVSYEVSLIIVLLSIIWAKNSLDFLLIMKYSYFSAGFFLPLCMVWFASMLAETNRTPYDFSEGESELVSGFNTEYSAGGFTLIFMSEYASIIFMGFLFNLFFFPNTQGFLCVMKTFIIIFAMVWVRGTMPRFRYDKLMYLAWKIFLPVSLFMLFYYLSFI